MVDSVNQKSFHSGEWAPNLYARVDLAKYHAGAALMRNFFVDYRGGASTRMGTKYILQAYQSATRVRLIPFSASFTVSYVLEFGEGYIRFYSNGAIVLETASAITGISQTNPAAVTQVAHGYSTGDTVFITGVGGMTQVNGRYFNVVVTGANTYNLTDLNGVPIDSSSYSAYTSGGTGARVYTLASPYAAEDLLLIKYAQNVNTLILCHPNYPAYNLTLVSATDWTITQVTYGATVAAPTSVSLSTSLGAGNFEYAYVVTAVDLGGQESNASTRVTTASKVALVSTTDSTTISWTGSAGAEYYNIYETNKTRQTLPTIPFYGYIGSSYSNSFVDNGATIDFSSVPPVAQQPFLGGQLISVTVTNAGTYTTVPTATVPAPSIGITAALQPILSVTGTPTSAGGNGGFTVGDIVANNTYGIRLVVASVNGPGVIQTYQPVTYPGSAAGTISTGSTPANPVEFIEVGFAPHTGHDTSVNLVWGVGSVLLINHGAGYTADQTVTFSAGAATATAVVSSVGQSFPKVPAFFQQRLCLGATTLYPQTLWLSKPGAYYNFDTSDPTQPDDSITATIVSKELNEIKAMIPMPSGLVILTSRQAWRFAGSAGDGISAVDFAANSQAFNGTNDVPPIVANYDILYVQSKGSVVRDLTYDFYKNIFTGTDISVLSSHLFFGHFITGWAFAEEPFKLVWAVRDDGVALSLTFLKEQEIVGWAHSDTDGSFTSVCTVTETVDNNTVDAVYWVVERNINGQTVKYIERMADRYLTSNAAPDEFCWCVDAGLQYNSTPATTFSGLWHLEGESVTGLADGVPVPALTVSNGSVTLAAPASVVTLGLPYTPELQTLILDMGEPTVIGRLKKIVAVTVRAIDTLGIWFGRTLATMVPMKDFSGSVDSQGVTIPDALTDKDARQPIDPKWDQDGQFYITQPYPLPATILGVVPEVKVEDRK